MNALGIIFSNIHDNNLPELTTERTMASIPFLGRYRLIDFALSNMINSGITKVGVITKSNYQSLMDHVGSGKDWDLARKNGGLMILPPFGVQENSMVYNTRLEALKGVSGFLNKSTQDYVIMTDSDFVCSMDLKQILKFHKQKQADVTMVYTVKGRKEISGINNIMFKVDEDSRVTELLFDPQLEDGMNLYSNIMLIKRSLLCSLIAESLAHGKRSFSKDVLAGNTNNMKIYGYKYEGYMSTISSLQNYYDISLGLLDREKRHQLFNETEIYTKVKDSVPTKYGASAVVKNSIIADGCVIEGTVENCILFRGVTVGKGAIVKNSIIMQDTVIGKGCEINYTISDKDVNIEEQRALQGSPHYPVFINKGTVI